MSGLCVALASGIVTVSPIRQGGAYLGHSRRPHDRELQPSVRIAPLKRQCMMVF
jgi:hypothetical protein